MVTELPMDVEQGTRIKDKWGEWEFNGEYWQRTECNAPRHNDAKPFEAYRSVVSGKVISTERQRKYDMQSTGSIDAREVASLPTERMNNLKG